LLIPFYFTCFFNNACWVFCEKKLRLFLGGQSIVPYPYKNAPKTTLKSNKKQPNKLPKSTKARKKRKKM
jgi:hypothetical protein